MIDFISGLIGIFGDFISWSFTTYITSGISVGAMILGMNIIIFQKNSMNLFILTSEAL